MSDRKDGLPIFGKGEVGNPAAASGSGGGIMQHLSRAVERRAPDVPVPVPAPVAQPKPPPPRASVPPPEPAIRFPMWCSVTGKPFIVIARRDGQTLHMLHNEAVQAGGGGAADDLPSLGAFRFNYSTWPGCLHCGAKDNRRLHAEGFWQCSQGGCGDAKHCVGDRGGLFRCACGKIEPRHFHQETVFNVRGSRAAAAASSPASTPGLLASTPSAGLLRLGRK